MVTSSPPRDANVRANVRIYYSKITGKCQVLILIIALGPDGPNAFKRYWEEEKMPFTGCADIKSRDADLYYQELNLLKLGRMPALFVIDKEGRILYRHYGDSIADIPGNREV